MVAGYHLLLHVTMICLGQKFGNSAVRHSEILRIAPRHSPLAPPPNILSFRRTSTSTADLMGQRQADTVSRFVAMSDTFRSLRPSFSSTLHAE